MELFDELKNLGADVEEALKLLNGNTSLYERLLFTFADLARETELVPHFDNGEYDVARDKAHKLKGVAGNLALTPLYKAYSEIVSLLREDKPEQARKVLDDTLPSQERIVQCIESHR